MQKYVVLYIFNILKNVTGNYKIIKQMLTTCKGIICLAPKKKSNGGSTKKENKSPSKFYFYEKKCKVKSLRYFFLL